MKLVLRASSRPCIALHVSGAQALRDGERGAESAASEALTDDDGLNATAYAAPGEELIKMTGVRLCLSRIICENVIRTSTALAKSK